MCTAGYSSHDDKGVVTNFSATWKIPRRWLFTHMKENMQDTSHI